MLALQDKRYPKTGYDALVVRHGLLFSRPPLGSPCVGYATERYFVCFLMGYFSARVHASRQGTTTVNFDRFARREACAHLPCMPIACSSIVLEDDCLSTAFKTKYGWQVANQAWIVNTINNENNNDTTTGIAPVAKLLLEEDSRELVLPLLRLHLLGGPIDALGLKVLEGGAPVVVPLLFLYFARWEETRVKRFGL